MNPPGEERVAVATEAITAEAPAAEVPAAEPDIERGGEAAEGSVPAEPAQGEPVQAEPAPAEPVSGDPAPAEPALVESIPGESAPVDPAPVPPGPAESAFIESAAMAPVPAEPVPDESVPVPHGPAPAADALEPFTPEKAAERRAAKIALARTFEALLLVQSGGVKLREAAKLLGVSYALAKETMDELVDTYALRGGGMIILREKGGFSLATAPDLAPALAHFVEVKEVRLSRAAYETLAVIALRQPITKAEIERIRGVNVDGVLGSLRERQFIRVMGRKKLVGQPKLFGVGIMFFKHFGIRSLRELRDYALKLKTLDGQEGDAAAAEAQGGLAALGALMGDIAIAAPPSPGEQVVAPPLDPEGSAVAAAAGAEDGAAIPEPGETPPAEEPEPEGDPEEM